MNSIPSPREPLTRLDTVADNPSARINDWFHSPPLFLLLWSQVLVGVLMNLTGGHVSKVRGRQQLVWVQPIPEGSVLHFGYGLEVTASSVVAM